MYNFGKQQDIILSHNSNTGHEDFLILKIAKKPHVKCKECDKIVWL